MRTSIKSLQDVNSFHDLRTYTGSIRKSGKPALPTTAILDLYMRRNERDRLERGLKGLKKRRKQLQKRLKEVEKDMTKLLEKATKTAVEIRGEPVKGRKSKLTKGGEKKRVLGY